MEFDFSEEQEAVRQLADRIFTERSTHERLKEVEQAAGDEGPFDRDLWAELAKAGLLGIALPEDVGGAGLDFVATCLVVEAAGRTAAHVPVVEVAAYAAPALDRFGNEAQRRQWLPRMAAGEVVATAAMASSSARWWCLAESLRPPPPPRWMGAAGGSTAPRPACRPV